MNILANQMFKYECIEHPDVCYLCESDGSSVAASPLHFTYMEGSVASSLQTQRRRICS